MASTHFNAEQAEASYALIFFIKSLEAKLRNLQALQRLPQNQ